MRPITITITVTSVLGLLITSTLAHADAIKDAEKLKKAGKVEEACALLAATDKAEPDDDVKLALAGCYTDLGKLGSAWHLYTALGKTEKAAKIAKQAPKLSVELKPKVARARIFAGTLDMSAALDTPTPIDAGEVELAVSAPGYAVWRKQVDIAEGETTTVPIKLEKQTTVAKIDPNDPDAPEPETIDSIERPARYSPFIHEIAISAEAGFMFTPQAYRVRGRAAYSYSSIVDVALVGGTRGSSQYPFEFGAGIDLRGTIPFGNFCRPFAHVEASVWGDTGTAVNVGGGLACRAWRSGDGPQLYFAFDAEIGDGPSYGLMVGIGKAIIDKR